MRCALAKPSAEAPAPCPPAWVEPGRRLSMGNLLTVRCGPGLGLDLERGGQASRSLTALRRQQRPGSRRRGTHLVQLLPGDRVLSPRPPALRPRHCSSKRPSPGRCARSPSLSAFVFCVPAKPPPRRQACAALASALPHTLGPRRSQLLGWVALGSPPR